MDRDVAVRIDGALMNVRSSLAGIAEYIRTNVAAEERKDFIHAIGKSMMETIEISNALHALFPDIVPKELRPPTGTDPKK